MWGFLKVYIKEYDEKMFENWLRLTESKSIFKRDGLLINIITCYLNNFFTLLILVCAICRNRPTQVIGWKYAYRSSTWSFGRQSCCSGVWRYFWYWCKTHNLWIYRRNYENSSQVNEKQISPAGPILYQRGK